MKRSQRRQEKCFPLERCSGRETLALYKYAVRGYVAVSELWMLYKVVLGERAHKA
jgi:hypothetical protein